MSTPLRLIEHMLCLAGAPRCTRTGPPCGTTLRRLVHQVDADLTRITFTLLFTINHQFVYRNKEAQSRVRFVFDCWLALLCEVMERFLMDWFNLWMEAVAGKD